jgi:hypothetical protein
MKNIFQFNKNAGALVVLLCCFFFNLGVGKAQLISNLVSPGGTNIKIIYEGEAICGQQPAGKFVNLGDFSVNASFSKQSLISQMQDIPKSQYFRIKKKGVGNPALTIQMTSSKFNGSTQWNGNSYFTAYAGTNSPNKIGPSPQGQYEYYVVKDPTYNFSGGLGFKYYLGDATSPNSPNYFNARCWPRADEVGYIVCFFEYSTLNSTYYEKFAFVLPFVIEGNVEESVPVLGTTVQPQIPYVVLHAPPGDGSSSEFQKDSTTCREFVDTYAEDGSNNINGAVKLGIAGSVGFIVTTDFEFSVTVSAGLTTGGLSVKTKSNQTCVTTSQGFSTNSLMGNNGGDVFIGYGTDLNYGIYTNVKIDPNTCKGIRDTNLIYSPTGMPRDFVYTEEQIQSEILTQKALAANPTYSVRARNEAQNQADVWEKVLTLNNTNKNNPNNALIQSLSFSAGANTSRESSISVLETNALDVEHYIEFNAGISSVVEVAGSGVSGGYEYKGSYRYGKSNTNSTENAKVVRYNLSDNSSGDLFNMKVVRDPMYGTPIFRLDAGTKTSCPYQGGYQRDQPKLKHDGSTSDHITLQGNPVGSSATFKLDICNESDEVRTYNLKLNAASNLNGAVVSAAGVPLNGNDLGQVFLNVPKNGCIENLVIEVKQLSAGSPLSYPDLELFLYAPCEEDIQSSVFASVYFGNATAVNDLADNSLLSVSPNPTSGWLQISLPTGNDLEAVRVMDLAGKTVRNLELGTGSNITEVDLSGLPKGMYALQARAAGQVFVKKVIVE